MTATSFWPFANQFNSLVNLFFQRIACVAAPHVWCLASCDASSTIILMVNYLVHVLYSLMFLLFCIPCCWLSSYYSNFFYFIFLAVLGLHCHTRASSSCSVWAFRCSGFFCCWTQALGCNSLVAPWHVGSSQMRDWTHVSTLAGRFVLIAKSPGQSWLLLLILAFLPPDFFGPIIGRGQG